VVKNKKPGELKLVPQAFYFYVIVGKHICNINKEKKERREQLLVQLIIALRRSDSMAKNIFSLPENYEVKEVAGLRGLVRHGKNGEQWILEPVYADILIARCMGKIIIACRYPMDYDSGYRLIDSKGNTLINIPIADVLFGDRFLYIRTIRPSSKTIEWCKVNEDFKGGKFLGDFEILGRDPRMPHHIQKDRETIMVRDANGLLKRIYLKTGEIEDEVAFATDPQPKKEYVVENYRVEINSNTNKVEVYDANGRGNSIMTFGIGEIGTYSTIITECLGGNLNMVPKALGDKFLTGVLGRFEYCGNYIGLLAAYQIAKRNNTKDANELVDLIIKELEAGWADIGGGYYIKGYVLSGIVIAMVALPQGKITTAVYKIRGEDGIVDVGGVQAIVNAYKSTGVKIVRLLVNEAVANDMNIDEIKLMPPYSVVQRKSLASDIKNYTYEQVVYYRMIASVVGLDNASYGNMEFGVLLFKNFGYTSKKKRASDSLVTTNICAVSIA
jgi:hypothetical protein